VIWWYTLETKRLRKEAGKQVEISNDQTKMDTLEKIHATMAQRESYLLRGKLHLYFQEHLVEATQATLGSEYLAIGRNGALAASVEKVLAKTQQSSENVLREFNKELQERGPYIGTVSAHEAVERILSDFDIISLPVWMGVKSAFEVAEVYKPVLRSTAELILPFVAIQRSLREHDSQYKEHYLYLLKKLRIHDNLHGEGMREFVECAKARKES
jgi:hypothetical protein